MPAAAQGEPDDCRVPALRVHPSLDWRAASSAFEQLPEACLKALFMACDEDANRRILDPGSAAICSIGYEALLKRGFGGDFHALLGWWRSQHPVNPFN
jgi:hypothetical protein